MPFEKIGGSEDTEKMVSQIFCTVAAIPDRITFCQSGPGGISIPVRKPFPQFQFLHKMVTSNPIEATNEIHSPNPHHSRNAAIKLRYHSAT
jgi:hypothetical protein